MGLDGVELVMALEEEFGVELTDAEAEKTLTPRIVGDLIFSKLESTDQRICQSQRAFYLLRNAFMSHFGLPRAAVTPDMPFRSLIPPTKEKDVWSELKRAINARSWPTLVRPQWALWSITASACVVFVAVLILLWKTIPIGAENAAMIAAAAMIGVSILGARTTRNFKTRIPARFRRIRDIVPFAVTSDHVKWTRDQVAVLVKQIVMEQLAIPEEKYWEDARFIEDLKLGQ